MSDKLGGKIDNNLLEETASCNPIRQAILDARHSGAWLTVGGIPLIARTIYLLRKAGITKSLVLLNEERPPVRLTRWQGDMELQAVPATAPQEAPYALLTGGGDLDRRFLYVDASHLIDPRILRSLTEAKKSTIAFIDENDRHRSIIRAGALSGDGIRIWHEMGAQGLIGAVQPLFPEDIDPFVSEIRGPLSPYFMQVCSRKDAEKATWVLIRSQQKHVMDLPAQYLDPPFENALTFFLCHTPITPNMVSVAGLLIATVAAWLFWYGYFFAGALLTFPVEVLDGVDGKLARTKLHFSKFGQHEDILDYFYENSWYVALGVGLGGLAADHSAARLAALLIVADTADNIFYTLAGMWYGKSIDLFHRFDAMFRKIAGRRNIYGILFIIGFGLGYPLETFTVVAFWAAITATIHGLRLVHHGIMCRSKLVGARLIE